MWDGGLHKRMAKSPVAAGVGDVTVNLPSVSGPGLTQEIPLDPATLPPLPMAVTSLGLSHDIATSSLYAGNVNLCFNVPALSATPAANLRVYHLENGLWINRTAAGATHAALCTTGVTSLSPFTIGRATPTAANVSVSGRVLTADGRGMDFTANP